MAPRILATMPHDEAPAVPFSLRDISGVDEPFGVNRVFVRERLPIEGTTSDLLLSSLMEWHSETRSLDRGFLISTVLKDRSMCPECGIDRASGKDTITVTYADAM